MVMEVDTPGTELTGPAGTRRGAHRRATSVLTHTEYTGGASLSERLTARGPAGPDRVGPRRGGRLQTRS